MAAYKITSICKGGGYRYCRTDPPHPKRNSNGLYPLHRVLMENKLGRNLLSDEVVHHKDEIKSNDNLDNLQLETKESHARLHKPFVEQIPVRCDFCDKEFWLRPHSLRLRKKRNKSMCCSRQCAFNLKKQRSK